MDQKSSTMDHMAQSSSTPMAMSSTFTLATTTPLFLHAWQPSTALEYALTCLFLVSLASLTRILIAIRPVLESASWRRRPTVAKYVRQNDDEHKDHDHHGDDEEEGQHEAKRKLGKPLKPVSGGQAILMAVRDHWGNVSVGSRLARAGFDVVIAGLGYLM